MQGAQRTSGRWRRERAALLEHVDDTIQHNHQSHWGEEEEEEEDEDEGEKRMGGRWIEGRMAVKAITLWTGAPNR